MVFSSIIFIFRFLVIALGIYYITPFKYKNFIILILSLFFYSFGEPKYFIIMIASIIVDYMVGIVIEKNFENRKKALAILLISITFNLGILFFFKYSNFFIENINLIFSFDIKILNLTLPLGISFYTFQTMTYSIDVYRGKFKAQRNIINFGAYVALFPQLIAGPIVRYSDIDEELEYREINIDKIAIGIRLFILGLARKVLIANNIGALWNEVQTLDLANLTTGVAWIGAIAFTIQIYFDFSGYSLMARGLGHMLGFTFPQNFNYPFISRSVSEFWKRWHITLGNFFREYVYIPLGGNKVSKKRLYINLLIVWMLTGFWHGAEYNFILWGLYFFVLIVIERAFLAKYLKEYKFISHVYLLFVIVISFVIFAISDMQILGLYLSRMFSFTFGTLELYYLKNYFVVIVFAIIFSIPFTKSYLERKIIKNVVLENMVLLSLFFVSVAYLVDASYNPFLYFRF